MSRFEAANLIRVFDFYLASMFLLSFARRYVVYWDALRLLVSLRGRWPKLLGRLRQHHGELVTREVIRPLLIALGLTVIQMVCSRVIWPRATLTVWEVEQSWWRLAAGRGRAVQRSIAQSRAGRCPAAVRPYRSSSGTGGGLP